MRRVAVLLVWPLWTALLAITVSGVNEETITHFVTVLPSGSSLQVPESFLGLSHEPLDRASAILDSPVYEELIKTLTSYNTGPFIIRWGGNNQDEQLQPFPDSHWQSMQRFHQATHTRYMLGLNLKCKNATLAALQVSNAMRFLPPEAVLAINIGNEADAFTFKMKNKVLYPDDYSTNMYFKDMTEYAAALAPIMTKYFNTTQLISGPACADMAQWHTRQFETFGKNPPLSAFTSMFTAHFYTYRSTSPGAGISIFMQEAKMDVARNRARSWVGYAKRFGMQFRMDESNTLAISGLSGASDTLGAALYYIDYSFTLMSVGAHGVNFHDSSCSAYSPILFPSFCNTTVDTGKYYNGCPDSCGNPNAPHRASAPYYGMLFTQMAITGLPSLMLDGVVIKHGNGAAANANVKVYVLKVLPEAGELRVVLVKKSGDMPALLSINVPGDYSQATVMRLQGPTLDAKVPDITIGGQKVSAAGRLTGPIVTESLRPTAALGINFYTVAMPPYSAALVTIRTQRAGSMSLSNFFA